MNAYSRIKRLQIKRYWLTHSLYATGKKFNIAHSTVRKIIKSKL